MPPSRLSREAQTNKRYFRDPGNRPHCFLQQLELKLKLGPHSGP